jgi:hypothetical protein
VSRPGATALGCVSAALALMTEIRATASRAKVGARRRRAADARPVWGRAQALLSSRMRQIRPRRRLGRPRRQRRGSKARARRVSSAPPP